MSLEKKLQLRPRRDHLLHLEKKLKTTRSTTILTARGAEHAFPRQAGETAMLQKEETARAVPPEAPADFYALAGAVRSHGAALGGSAS